MSKLVDKISKKIVNKSKFYTIIANELRNFGKKFTTRVPTRWNSMLFMIRSVLKVSSQEFLHIKSKILEPEDRVILNELKYVLAKFPSISFLKHHLLFDIEKVVHTVQLRKDLYDSLITRFGDFVKDDVCIVSTFLDPCFGLKAFEKTQKIDVLSKMTRLLEAVSAS